jgi:hypothetical protein
MSTDLRIPLTQEQKSLMVAATKDEPEGLASWARTILLRMAAERIERSKANQIHADKALT